MALDSWRGLPRCLCLGPLGQRHDSCRASSRACERGPQVRGAGESCLSLGRSMPLPKRSNSVRPRSKAAAKAVARRSICLAFALRVKVNAADAHSHARDPPLARNSNRILGALAEQAVKCVAGGCGSCHDMQDAASDSREARVRTNRCGDDSLPDVAGGTHAPRDAFNRCAKLLDIAADGGVGDGGAE